MAAQQHRGRCAAGLERATAVVVLRGERGMGKTCALSQEHDALLADGLHAIWLKLKQCTTTRLRRPACTQR